MTKNFFITLLLCGASSLCFAPGDSFEPSSEDAATHQLLQAPITSKTVSYESDDGSGHKYTRTREDKTDHIFEQFFAMDKKPRFTDLLKNTLFTERIHHYYAHTPQKNAFFENLVDEIKTDEPTRDAWVQACDKNLGLFSAVLGQVESMQQDEFVFNAFQTEELAKKHWQAHQHFMRFSIEGRKDDKAYLKSLMFGDNMKNGRLFSFLKQDTQHLCEAALFEGLKEGAHPSKKLLGSLAKEKQTKALDVIFSSEDQSKAFLEDIKSVQDTFCFDEHARIKLLEFVLKNPEKKSDFVNSLAKESRRPNPSLQWEKKSDPHITEEYSHHLSTLEDALRERLWVKQVPPGLSTQQKERIQSNGLSMNTLFEKKLQYFVDEGLVKKAVQSSRKTCEFYGGTIKLQESSFGTYKNLIDAAKGLLNKISGTQNGNRTFRGTMQKVLSCLSANSSKAAAYALCTVERAFDAYGIEHSVYNSINRALDELASEDKELVLSKVKDIQNESKQLLVSSSKKGGFDENAYISSGTSGTKDVFTTFAKQLSTNAEAANAWCSKVLAEKTGEDAVKCLFLGEGLRAHFPGSGSYHLQYGVVKNNGISDEQIFDNLTPENKQKVLDAWQTAKNNRNARGENLLHNTAYLSGKIKDKLVR